MPMSKPYDKLLSATSIHDPSSFSTYLKSEELYPGLLRPLA
jgi:hypothetical protein